MELLGKRLVLADLGLGIQLFEDSGATQIIDQQTGPVKVGQEFFLRVDVRDQRQEQEGSPAGIIALPLDLSWATEIIDYAASDPPPLFPQVIPLSSPLVTDHFPLQRFVTGFDGQNAPEGQADGLRGAGLPGAGTGTGTAIGKGAPEGFSLLHFKAVGAGMAMPFPMTLAGSMSFADAARFDEVATIYSDSTAETATYTVTARVRVQAAVAGTKFEDLNGNGERDAGEPGLPGWTICAYADDGDGVLQPSEVSDEEGTHVCTVTGADGTYELGLDTGEPSPEGSCPAGTSQAYVIVETLQDGWTQSFPRNLENDVLDPALSAGAVELADHGYSITVQPCDPNDRYGDLDADALNFGNYRKTSISGYKWHDLNADGTWQKGADGLPNTSDAGEEPTLEGWTINLAGTDGFGNPVTRSAVTRTNGFYEFKELNPGTYTVSEVLQADWSQTYPDTPGDGDWDVPLISGQNDNDNDFGNYQPARISGYKWHDLNADGIWQKGADGLPNTGDAGEEPTLDDWWICVFADTGTLAGKLDADDELVDCRHLAAGGWFSFLLDPGAYIVVEELLPEWHQSWPTTDVDGSARDYAENGYAVTLISGQVDDDNHFGNYQNAAKSGFKWEDLNADGLWQQAAEPGLPGRMIEAMQNGVVVETATTDEDGYYEFSDDNGNGLKPGTYTFREVLLTGWSQTYPPDPGTYTETLESGAVSEGNNFGDRRADISLSGFVYADVDKDARRDVDQQGVPIELGLPQVEIALYRDSQLVKTDWTGPDGWYHFEDLEPGVYDIVEVAQPACFIDGTETLGIVLPGEQSRGAAGADRFTGITIAAGEHGIDYNFGELGLKAACINKSLFFGSADPRRDTVYTPLGVSSAVVRGTSGDDQIAVEASAGAIRVTVNSGRPQTISTADAAIVVVDSGAGHDEVTAGGSTIAAAAQFQPSYGALRLANEAASSASATASPWDHALEAVSAEMFQATAAADRDAFAVLRDSSGNDQLNAGADEAELIYAADEDLIARAVAFDRVRAISTAGGADEADQAQPVDFELQLLGDWQS